MYFILVPIVLSMIVIYLLIKDLKAKNKELTKRIDDLVEKLGYMELSSIYISDSLKSELIKLKNNGDTVKAVKLLRENTSLDLIQAKKYIDILN